MADLILPGSSYTEQDGYFTNLEGKIQKAFKATYPPGEAKEDWLIINELSELIKRKKLFNNKEELINSMLNFIKNKKQNQPSLKRDTNFNMEKILVDDVDYYYSNVIARSSKTMTECRNIKLNLNKTGTEG